MGSARRCWLTRVVSALLASAFAFSLAWAPSAVAADFTAGQIIAAVNAERSANGIPGDLVEEAAMTHDCYLHDEYGNLNGTFDAYAHGETLGKPGYSIEGSDGGRSSVLAQGLPWSLAHGDVWETAPFHLVSIMNPYLTTTGADEHGSYPFDCLWTSTDSAPDINRVAHGLERPRSSVDTIFTFPGAGRTDVPWYEYESESPQVPEYTLGLTSSPQGSGIPRGRVILAYWDGPVDVSHPDLGQLCTASMLDLAGGSPVSVPVDTLDRNQIGFLTPDSGMILPPQPLAPSTEYQVTATFGDSACDANPRYSRTFSFTTAPLQPAASMIHIGEVVAGAGHLDNLSWHISDPLSRGTGTTTIATNYLGNASGIPWEDSTISFPPPGPGQSLTLTLTSNAFTIGGTTWPPVTVSRTVSGPPVEVGSNLPPTGGTGSGGQGTGNGGAPLAQGCSAGSALLSCLPAPHAPVVQLGPTGVSAQIDRVSHRGFVSVALYCRQVSGCSGVVSLVSLAGHSVFGRRRFTVPGGRTSRIPIHVSAKLLALLRVHGGAANVRVAVVVAANTVTQTIRLKSS